jgi:hypothetical protein
VDFSRLGTGYRIMVGAAVLLFIDMFLGWYEPGGVLGDLNIDANAWEIFDITDILMLLTIILAIGAAVLHLRNLDGATPIPPPMAVVAVGAYTTLVILYRIINQPGENSLIDVKFGAYLGLVLCALVTFGAFKALTEDTAPRMRASSPASDD